MIMQQLERIELLTVKLSFISTSLSGCHKERQSPPGVCREIYEEVYDEK